MFKTAIPTKAITKRMLSLLLLAMTALMFSLPALSVQSLRGDSALDAAANKAESHKVNTQQGGYERSFKKQPPLIPHKIEKYSVTLKNNGCMKCHSEKAYKKEKAPKVGDSHYITRDGKTQDTISMRRYFCSQCHVPQVKSEPLVENTHEGN